MHVETWHLPRLDGKVVNEPMEESDEPEEEPEPELVPPSAAELQAIRDAAREEGYQEGLAQGHAAGVEQGHEEGFQEGFLAGKADGEKAGLDAGAEKSSAELATLTADLTKRFGLAIAALNDKEAALEAEWTPVIRDLVLRLAQSLVVDSLRHNPAQIEQMVHQAIQLMPAAHERIDISLHKDDLAIMREVNRPWLEHVQLHEDPALSPGGCTLKTRHSLLDYSLSNRYAQQVLALLDIDSDSVPDNLRTLNVQRFAELVNALEAPVQDAENDTPSVEAAPESATEAAEQPSAEPLEDPQDQTAEQSAEQSAEQPSVHPKERLAEQVDDQASAEASAQTSSIEPTPPEDPHEQ